MTSPEWAHYNLFEYEKVLAKREWDALISQADPTGLSSDDLLLDRSTYFHQIGGSPTSQAITEALHHAERGSRPNRQATRYLVHGLHEYKGKFNPQMARALINAIDPSATSLMDPYCGSGTTLVEGMRLGLSVTGIDQNPLAVWISQIKVDALRLARSEGLVERFTRLTTRVTRAMEGAQEAGRAATPDWVSAEDDAYLRHWFPESVLASLWAGLRECRGANDPVSSIVEVCMSNIVRQVSWQLPEDLRVRRRPSSWHPPSVAEVFSPAADLGVRALSELEHAPAPWKWQSAAVHAGSSRDAGLVSAAWPEGRRIVVTSPPYATALPYIDTDRLSIILFGLAPATQIRRLEQELTGSREWSTTEAARWMGAWTENASDLPDEILRVLAQIEANNRDTDAGFRRKAVPSLLYRYFAQMGETLDALAQVMRSGEHVVMVVGNNRTGSGSQQVSIPTPHLLGLLAATRGYDYTERISLETWARYGMHSKNAVNGEDAVVMTLSGNL